MRMSITLMAGLLWSHVAMMGYAILTGTEYDNAITHDWIYALLFVMNLITAIALSLAAWNKKYFEIALQATINLMVTSAISIWAYGIFFNPDVFIFSLQRGMRYALIALLVGIMLHFYKRMVWSENLRKSGTIRQALNDVLEEQEVNK